MVLESIKNNIRSKKGFSLIEMIMYISIMSFVFVIIVNFLVVYGIGYNSFKASSRINASAITSLERITREIKSASSVDTGLSVLGSNPGKLVLNTTDGGSPIQIEFYVSGSAVMVKKNNVVIGELTKNNVTVDNLVFDLSTVGNSELVKVEIDISTPLGTTTKTASFLGSSVLRGSY